MVMNDQLMRLVASKLEALGFRTDNDNIVKTKKITITYADGTVETDTDFTFPAKAIVLPNVLVDVRVAEATGGTKTIDVGTSTVSNDPNGFLAGIDVSSIALVKGTLASGGQTLGALLSVYEDVAGALVPEQDLTSLGAVVSWTPGSNDFAELEADIYISYIDLT